MNNNWYDEKDKKLQNLNASMPCFSCNSAYTCKYFKNSAWTQWILSYKICPPYNGYSLELINQIYHPSDKTTK